MYNSIRHNIESFNYKLILFLCLNFYTAEPANEATCPRAVIRRFNENKKSTIKLYVKGHFRYDIGQ